MSFASSLFRRACDPADPNSAACEKPTSNVLLDAVPAAVVGVMLIIAGTVFFVIARKRRKQFDAEAAKERESFEIDIYEPTVNNRRNPAAYPNPFNDSHGLNRDPDYNEFSLTPSRSEPDPFASRSSLATESTHGAYAEMPAPPPAYHEGARSGAARKAREDRN